MEATTTTGSTPSPFAELTNSCTPNPTQNGKVTRSVTAGSTGAESRDGSGNSRRRRRRPKNKTRATQPTPLQSDDKEAAFVQSTAKNDDKPKPKCDTAPPRAAVGTGPRQSTQPSGRNAAPASSRVHDQKEGQVRELLPRDNNSLQQQHHQQQQPNYFRGRNHGTPSTTADRAKQINQTIVTLGKSKRWWDILALFLNEKDNFDNVNYSTVMVQLRGMRSFNRSDTRFIAFLDSLQKNIEKQGLSWIQVRQASTIIHAIGKMKLINRSTKWILSWISGEVIANQFVENAVRKRETQSIANTVWAFATLQVKAPKLLAAIEAHSNWLFQNGNVQDVANTVWAFATLQTEAPNLCCAIEAQPDWLVQSGSPQEVANTVWAFAALKTKAPNLFSAVEARSDWLVENGTPQNVANTAWAFATLKTEAPKLLSKIEARSDWLVKHGTPQNVANTVCAFAKLEAKAPKLLSAIEAQSDRLVQKGNAQDVANTAWAFATLQVEAPNFLSAIEARSDWLVKHGTPQSVANTAWAFAKLQIEAPNFFLAIEAQSEWLVKNGDAQGVANTAWAFATIGFEGTRFFDALGQNTMTVPGKEFCPQDVANLCFAIAIAGRVNKSVFLLRKLWDIAIQLYDDGATFLDKTFCQLAQSQVFARVWEVELSDCPASMTCRMEETLKARSTEDNVVSSSSKEVSEILKTMGFHHECEVAPDDNILGGMMAIDFACAERKVAIEFDGDSHFLKAPGSGELTFKRNGKTKAKRRLLEQLKWTVVNLDFRDLIEARENSCEEQWLRKELENAGVQLPSLD